MALPMGLWNKEDTYGHSENNCVNDLTVLLLKISTTFSSAIGKLGMYLFINLFW